MKKIFEFIIPLLALMAACTGGNDYKIAVIFPDADNDGKMLYLTSYDSGDTIDSVKIENKCAELKGSVETPYYARIIIGGERGRTGMIVEPGDITLDMETGVASGTELNERLNNLSKSLETIEGEYDKISERFRNKEITEEEANKLGEEVEAKLVAEFEKAYNDNRDNAIGPWALNQWIMSKDRTSAEIDKILSEAPESYKSLKRMIKAKNDALAREKTAVGQKYTDFTITTDKGKTSKLSDFIDGKDVVVVDFFASWCGPCRAEIEKSLKPMYEKYNGKGLKIVGVAVWDKPEDTRGVIEEMQIPWDVMVGNHYMTEQTDLYGIAGIPHIMIIDRDGKIVSRGLQGDKLVAEIEKQMSK